tara:strand:+ start:4120 stop:5565 length:1446 start_codon:yes stop_codon:yes gene_type:complete
MSNSHKEQLIAGLFWSFAGQISYWIVALIANIILARLLTTYEFGQIGIVLFFIAIARVFTDAGLGGALVRNNKATERDFSTIFLTNLILSIAIVVVLILSSGSIAKFYNDLELKNILIASSSVILFNAFQLVQITRLIKNMEFQKKALYDFIAIFIASTVAIILAIKGFGVWSIVLMQILISFFQCSMYWYFEGGIGPWVFDRSSFRTHYKFGINTTLASIINTVFKNIYQLILGKYFTINQTGLYYQAQKLQEVPIGVIKSLTSSVVFSSLSKIQEDKNLFNIFYRRIISLFTVAVGLICMLIYFYAENIILMFYGPNWIEAVFYLEILIISSFFYMQESFNRIIFKVFDKTEKILLLEIIKKFVQILSIIIGIISLSIEVLLYGFLITSVLSFFMNYYVSRKIQPGLSWHELIVVLKVIIISVVNVIIGRVTLETLHIEGFNSFYLTPLVLIVFLVSIYLMKVSNVITDIKIAIKTFRR